LRLLLDTHVLIWTLLSRGQLSAAAIDAIEDEANEVFVSVVSAWEIEIKQAKGKLRIPGDLDTGISAQGFQPLQVGLQHVFAVESLPRHHRDPFDRMLITQAQLGGMTLITSDGAIRKYPVAVLPAT
jgi:PIN domain nuclease of toxin-antitoxin system